MERATDEAEAIMYQALTKGLNFKLTMGNIITLTPPLTITREQMDAALDILAECLTEIGGAQKG
jgi:4-aminobutyrate aminotransferase